MDDLWLRFLLAALATWRVTHLVAYEDGPWNIVLRLRTALGNGFFGNLMDCFQCASLWLAAPFAFFVDRGAIERAVAWLALSGAACLIDRLARGAVIIQPVKTEGDSDALLRPGSDGPANEHPVKPEREREDNGHNRAVH
jgi:hypothetical protein